MPTNRGPPTQKTNPGRSTHASRESRLNGQPMQPEPDNEAIPEADSDRCSLRRRRAGSPTSFVSGVSTRIGPHSRSSACYTLAGSCLTSCWAETTASQSRRYLLHGLDVTRALSSARSRWLAILPPERSPPGHRLDGRSPEAALLPRSGLLPVPPARRPRPRLAQALGELLNAPVRWLLAPHREASRALPTRLGSRARLPGSHKMQSSNPHGCAF